MLVLVIRRGNGVRARRHTIRLEVGRVRLCNDVHGARRVLALMFVRCRRLAASCAGGGLCGQLGVLEGGEGGVERAAERLREGAGVFGGCYAECGHGLVFVGLWKLGGGKRKLGGGL